MEKIKPMRVKGQSFTPFTEQARADYQKVILNHADGFDALLYRPISEDSKLEKPLNDIEFSELNEQVDDIQYQDPTMVICVESNNDDGYFYPSFDADESMGFGETQTIILRVSDFDVPQGSILEFLVSLSNGDTQRQFWYVHRSQGVGTPAIGFIHLCIPCGDVEHLDFTPEPSQIEPVKEEIEQEEAHEFGQL